MLADCNLDQAFWDFAYETASNLRNMVPTTKHFKSPDELFLGQKTNIRKLKLFGSRVMFKVNAKHELKKLQHRARVGTYLDFNPTTQCYRILDLERMELIKSREIILLDDKFKPGDKVPSSPSEEEISEQSASSKHSNGSQDSSQQGEE